METLQTRNRIAELLLKMAEDDHFDKEKYSEFGRLISELPPDPLLDAAFNELTEYSGIWNEYTIIGWPLGRTPPDPGELYVLRDNLKRLAEAIRKGLGGFSTEDEARKQILGE